MELKNEGGKDNVDVDDVLATWGHGGVQAQDVAKGYVHGPTPTRVYVDIHGPCCHLRPHRYSGSGLPPVAMLMSGSCATLGAMPI